MSSSRRATPARSPTWCKPFQRSELVPAVELAIGRFRELAALVADVKTLEEQLETRKTVDRAKGILMDRHGLPESQAFSFIQKTAMSDRSTMRSVANRIHRGRTDALSRGFVPSPRRQLAHLSSVLRTSYRSSDGPGQVTNAVFGSASMPSTCYVITSPMASLSRSTPEPTFRHEVRGRVQGAAGRNAEHPASAEGLVAKSRSAGIMRSSSPPTRPMISIRHLRHPPARTGATT